MKVRLISTLLFLLFFTTMIIGTTWTHAHSIRAGFQARDVAKERARASTGWVRDAVIYEIFTRNFSAEGNFNGITAKLDHLQNLGVTVLWLMPIHPTGGLNKKGSIGSPYAVRDYYAIHPDYGSQEDFKRLVSETHKRGMKIIIDIVANHTAWDSVLMKQAEFYKRDAQGKTLSPYDWSDVAWLNYDNPKVREYMMDMLKYWIREFDLDGFRCDVAWLVPTDFWEKARVELEKIKPELIMISEATYPEHLVKAFDMDYAWPFFHTLEDVLTGRSTATEVRKNWEAERARYPQGALRMRFIDDHDERRALAEFGRAATLAGSVLFFTMDGVPLLYNGMEVGDTTESRAPALFERLPIFWKNAEHRPEIPRFYKQIIALRKAHPALRSGETLWLRNAAEARVVTYVRHLGDEEILVAINLSNQSFTGQVEVGNASSFTEITPNISGEAQVKTKVVGLPALALEPWGWRVFLRKTR
ncbi:MAG: alpha-amylase family glycosyl hydrolase [Acidobacteriota bacterium]